jgi:hypothetical protein
MQPKREVKDEIRRMKDPSRENKVRRTMLRKDQTDGLKSNRHRREKVQ